MGQAQCVLAILYSGSQSFRACSYSYKGSLRGSYGAPRPSPPHDCHDVPNVPHLVLGPLEEKEVKLSDLQTVELAACACTEVWWSAQCCKHLGHASPTRPILHCSPPCQELINCLWYFRLNRTSRNFLSFQVKVDLPPSRKLFWSQSYDDHCQELVSTGLCYSKSMCKCRTCADFGYIFKQFCKASILCKKFHDMYDCFSGLKSAYLDFLSSD